MRGLSPFGGGSDGQSGFDEYDEFVPEHLPEPGSFLAGHDLLTDEDHVAFHEVTREIFEERGVYDVTFGYNLARLNLDRRHPDAGFRYAEDADEPSVLRAEFTPTTPFCPQSDALTTGSLRAWNGLSDRLDYDLVVVRLDESHHESDSINADLADLEEYVREHGSLDGAPRPTGPACSSGRGGAASRGPNAPF